MAHYGSKIEEVISVLSTMEKELDEVMVRVSDMKRALMNVAREEAEKVKGEVIGEATSYTQQALAQIKAEAEKEAEKILSKGDEDLQTLKGRIDQAFDKAVSLVVRAALGEQL